MMLLVLDVGNTNVTAGLYEGADLRHHWRVSTHRGWTADEFGLTLVRMVVRAGVPREKVQAAALSSVVPPLTPFLAEALRVYFGAEPLQVGNGLQRGLPALDYENPAALGADRLANAVGGWTRYGGAAGHQRTVAVVDLGTATKMEVVRADGTYLGGVIAPGISTSLQALWTAAARLPRVELARPPRVLGKNNAGAVQSGVRYGFAGQVNGLIERASAELGEELYAVATGGLAGLVADDVPCLRHVDPWLTLEGIRTLWEWNRA